MTIDETIRVLENEIRISELNNRPYEVSAFKLGIEALKRVQLYRKGMYIGLGDKMPGETKE